MLKKIHFEKTAAKDTQLDEDKWRIGVTKHLNKHFVVIFVIFIVSLLKKTCYRSKIYQNLKIDQYAQK